MCNDKCTHYNTYNYKIRDIGHVILKVNCLWASCWTFISINYSFRGPQPDIRWNSRNPTDRRGRGRLIGTRGEWPQEHGPQNELSIVRRGSQRPRGQSRSPYESGQVLCIYNCVAWHSRGAPSIGMGLYRTLLPVLGSFPLPPTRFLHPALIRGSGLTFIPSC